MKRNIVSTLALCALAGSAFVASAASTKAPDRGDHYDLNVSFTNPPVFTSVSGLPSGSKTILNAFDDQVIFTDGSGKVEGVTSLAITNPGGSAAYGIYVADIAGNITTVKTNTTVKLTIKANGYAEASPLTDQQSSSANLSFATAKNSGISSNTETFSFTTNVTIIFLGNDGTTNDSETISPGSAFNQNAFSNLVVTYHFSTNWTIGNTNVVDNQIYQVIVSFGATVATNSGGTIAPPLGFGFNPNTNFPSVAIAQQTGSTFTNVSAFGLDITNVAAFIASINVSNGPINQLVVSVKTNASGSAFSVASGVNITNFLVSIPGTLSGTIKVGKTTTKVNESANLVGSANWVASGFFGGDEGQGRLVLVNTNIEVGFFSTNSGVSTNFVMVTNGVITAVPLGTNQVPFTNFPTFFAQSRGSGIDLFTERTLPGEVVQLGKKMWLAVNEGDGDFGFSGTGNLTTKTKKTSGVSSTNTTYTANLKGVGRGHGSSLKLTGTNGFLFTQYTVSTSAPPTVLSITNLAANPPLVVTFTNASTNAINVNSTTLFTVNGVTYTNTLGGFGAQPGLPGELFVTFATTNTAAANLYSLISLSAAQIRVPPALLTNTVPLAIKTVIKTGKIMGQTLPADKKNSVPVTGLNQDARFPFNIGAVPVTVDLTD